MAERLACDVWILLNPTFGIKKAGRVVRHTYISKGELLIEIPKKEQTKEEENTPHNYCLLHDPGVTLYDDGSKVTPLVVPEADYLEGVKDPHSRFLEYRKEDRLKWIMNLKLGDVVFFKLKRDKSSSVPLLARGKVKWYGVVQGETGVMFWIEITDPEHRGKGTTNGRPYFNCNDRDGVFVSMDKIIAGAEGAIPNRENKAESVTSRQPNTGGTLAQNTRSKASVVEEEKETWVNKVINKGTKAVSNFLSGGSPPVDPSQYNFSPGDRVVVLTARGKVVTGTVRWVGPMRAAGKVIVPAVVGIETVSCLRDVTTEQTL